MSIASYISAYWGVEVTEAQVQAIIESTTTDEAAEAIQALPAPPVPIARACNTQSGDCPCPYPSDAPTGYGTGYDAGYSHGDITVHEKTFPLR